MPSASTFAPSHDGAGFKYRGLAPHKFTPMPGVHKEKGSQFDPFLVDVFIECLNDSPFEMKDFSYYF